MSNEHTVLLTRDTFWSAAGTDQKVTQEELTKYFQAVDKDGDGVATDKERRAPRR